jgi:hypothetical protein
MPFFWDVASCSLVEIDGRFRGVYCFHCEGDVGRKFLKRRSVSTRLHGAASQKTVIFRKYIASFVYNIKTKSGTVFWLYFRKLSSTVDGFMRAAVHSLLL